MKESYSHPFHRHHLLLFSALIVLSNPSAIKAQCPELIWSDEFDGTALDESKWTPQIGDGCTLGPDLCGWGNNEWQYYTNDQGPDGNIEVSDGTLKIHARYDTEKQQYTSARLRSLGKADLDMSKPVRIEARMKVPLNSKGLWPAFWMLPSQLEVTEWPKGGEIDIMEFIGREPNKTYGVMHYGNLWNDKSQQGGPLDLQEHVGKDFHIFTLEKTRNAMTWYVDGYQFLYYTNEDIEDKFQPWPYESVFHFILNLAVGGNWPEYPDASTQFPATLEVDYIRVYDLRTSQVRPSPRMDGPELVRRGDRNVRYCVKVGHLVNGTDYEVPIEWTVPEGSNFNYGATFPSCIRVMFGKQSGYVQAKVKFSCGETITYSVPVEVQDRYGADVVMVGPRTSNEPTSYVSSTGIYTVVAETGNTPATVVYQRKLEEVYDHIIWETSIVGDPNLYVESARKFFMDAYSQTAAPCTRFLLQLEDSSLATPENYPVGRHSRYISFLQKDVDFQRMEFDFYDLPDTSVTQVDRIVLLIDSYMQRADIYKLRNLVSAMAGCTENCEPLSTNACRVAAKSEEGACTDGFNNDGFGYNGDGPMDCEDSDCWDDPACQEGGTSYPTEAPLSGVTPAPVSPTPPPAVPSTPTLGPEVCDDRIDNDGNGYMDCEDEACASDPACGSYWEPKCSAYSQCVEEGHVGDCCPGPLGDYKECCNNVETSASCSVNPKCAVLGLVDDCCPTADGTFLSCCEPQLCLSNPKCSGLEGACCPTDDGEFLDCCEEKPETCKIHPNCDAAGLQGECCPTPDGVFLDCCEPQACEAHPACNGLADDCCPTSEGIFLDCCNLDMPMFEGFSGTVVEPSVTTVQTSKLEAMPTGTSKSSASIRWFGTTMLLVAIFTWAVGM